MTNHLHAPQPDLELTLQRANEGRALNIAWSSFGPIVRGQKEIAYAELLMKFRAGEEPAKFVPALAKLVAFEDLEHAVKMAVERGERAAGELGEKRV